MKTQIFWPSDLLQTSGDNSKLNTIGLGYNLYDAILVVLATVHYNDIDQLVEDGVMKKEDDGYVLNSKNDQLAVVCSIGEADWWRGLCLTMKDDKLYEKSSRIIVFDPPNPTMMQFFSLKPISVSLPERDLDLIPEIQLNRQVSQIKEHTPARYHSQQEKEFEESIRLLNKCWKERKELLCDIPKIQRNWEKSRSWNLFFQKFHELLFMIVTSLRNIPFQPIKMGFIHTTLAFRSLAILSIKFLNGRLSPEFPSLVELSATAQQIDLRLQQFCYAPIQYMRTTRKINWNDMSLSHMRSPVENSLPIDQYPEYIRFYNTLWLVINDVTLGITIGAFLIDNQQFLIERFNTVVISRILYVDLKKISMWLMNSPGGVKLNTALSIFFSELFTWIIEFWKLTLINSLQPRLSAIFYTIALSSTFGATLSIAIFSDFLSVITFHIYCFYFASARIFNWQLGILQSLFNLFCGRKRNILRNRIDSNDYDLDQLLLGTLLFTVMLFLLPTVFAFYVTFAAASLIIMALVSSLELTMSCLNHFPIFVILLRIKDPRRTPGGIIFKNSDGYLKIEGKPLRVGKMFEPFNNVLIKLKKSYFSFKTLQDIITGHSINVQRNKFYKMLYSALPAEPAETSEVWKAIGTR